MTLGKKLLIKTEKVNYSLIFKFFYSWRKPYLGKIEIKLKLTSPHVREPDYCHYYYSIVNWDVVFQLYM